MACFGVISQELSLFNGCFLVYDDNSDEFYDALDDADLIISMPYQR